MQISRLLTPRFGGGLTKVVQALENLLDNAVRHGSKGRLDEAKTDVKDAGEDAENALDR
jgi:hypothetical protein